MKLYGVTYLVTTYYEQGFDDKETESWIFTFKKAQLEKAREVYENHFIKFCLEDSNQDEWGNVFLSEEEFKKEIEEKGFIHLRKKTCRGEEAQVQIELFEYEHNNLVWKSSESL